MLMGLPLEILKLKEISEPKAGICFKSSISLSHEVCLSSPLPP